MIHIAKSRDIVNRYCKDIAIGFEASTVMLDSVRSSYTVLDRSSIFKGNANDIDGRIMEFLHPLGLDVIHVEIFYTCPGRFTSIHVDGPEIDDHCKINWVYGAPGSRMIWYEDAPGSPGPRKMTTRIGSSYLAYDTNHCVPVHHAEVGRPSLVNAGIPHNVHNTTDDQRWCVSLVLGYAGTERKFVKWDDAAVIFRDFFVN